MKKLQLLLLILMAMCLTTVALAADSMPAGVEPVGIPAWLVTMIGALVTAAIGAVGTLIKLALTWVKSDAARAVLEKVRELAIPVLKEVWKEYVKACKEKAEGGKLTKDQAKEAMVMALAKLKSRLASGELKLISDSVMTGVLEGKLGRMKSDARSIALVNKDQLTKNADGQTVVVA